MSAEWPMHRIWASDLPWSAGLEGSTPVAALAAHEVLAQLPDQNLVGALPVDVHGGRHRAGGVLAESDAAAKTVPVGLPAAVKVEHDERVARSQVPVILVLPLERVGARRKVQFVRGMTLVIQHELAGDHEGPGPVLLHADDAMLIGERVQLQPRAGRKAQKSV